MDRDNYEFLHEMTKEEGSDLSKAVREMVTRGRVLLAVERLARFCDIMRNVAEAYTMNLSSSRAIRVSVLAILICLVAPGAARAQTAAADRVEDPAEALMKQGAVDAGARKYDDALNAFKKANQLRQNNCADCYFQMAIVQTKTGDYGEALKSCDKAISCATTDSVRVSSHTLKGNVLQFMGDDPKKLKAAEAEYRAALALDTNSAQTHFNLGIVLLRESQDAEGTQELNSYLRLAPNGPDATYAKKVIAEPRKAGQTLAPDFTVRAMDGQEITLSHLAGKIVVMDFWATWCPPCRASVPELQALTKKYSRDKLVLISFSADNEEQPWRDLIAKKNMDWPQYWDRDGRIRDEFSVHAFPTYLVIDPDGFIHQRIVGLNPQQSVVARLKDAVHAMLPE
jgi:thiol-disulfide isomerase/thioredoxin